MNQTVTVVNIAAGDPDLLNDKTVRTIKESTQFVLRTSNTPLVSWLEHESVPFSSMDRIYDDAEDFDTLSSLIAKRLWTLSETSPVVYAVPDMITDASITSLYSFRPEDGRINVIPGLGLSDLYHSSFRPYLTCSDLRTISAIDFLTSDFNPNNTIIITELDNIILAGEVKLHLSSCLDDEFPVLFIHEKTEPVSIPLYKLDRQSHISHLSAVLIPGSGYLERNHFVLQDLMHIMDKLRAPDGCPWDKAQTHLSLRSFMVEEAWECVAAIEQNDPDHLAEELGDLLFQIVFHSSIGLDYDEFSMADVVNSICRKMIHRHPHVFAGASYPLSSSAAEWEKLKRSETGKKSITESLDDVSTALPALKYASKMLKKISLLPTSYRKTDEIISDIHKLNSCLVNSSSLSDEIFLEHALLLYAELCFSLNLDGELLLHNAVTDLKKRTQAQFGNKI